MTRRPIAMRLALGLCALALYSSVAHAVTLESLQRLIDAGHYEQAAAQSQSYLKAHPGNRDARFVHARALAGVDEPKKAIAAYRALAEDFPMRVEPANNLGVLYARQGDYRQARKWLQKALATQPAYATAHRNLGDVYTALADLAYHKALNDPDTDNRVVLTLLDRLYYAGEAVAAADQPEAVPSSANVSLGVLQTVRAWALAWSTKNFDAYADFYAKGFDPGANMTRKQWLAVRRARLKQPRDIHISIQDPTIEQLSATRVAIHFAQYYESGHYLGRVNKRLLLEHSPAGWRILRETTALEK